jgi:MoaA/NifB/PqqE/SkfB family radical SAM enzyme
MFDIEANWIINTLCNYRCEYCFGSSQKEHISVGTLSPYDYFSFFESTKKTWLFHFTGGEPFLVKNFVDICYQLQRSHYIAIDTNLTPVSTDQFLEKIDPLRVEYIHIGLHPAERERQGGIKMLLNRTNQFRRKGFTIFVSLVMTPKMFPVFQNLSCQFADYGLIILPKALRGIYFSKPYPESYTQSERMLFINYYEKLKVKWRQLVRYSLSQISSVNPMLDADFLDGWPNFLGNLCSAGRKFIRITPDGSCFRCGQKTKLGSLAERKLHLLKEDKMCDDSCCPYICFAYSNTTIQEAKFLPKRFKHFD